MSVSKPHANRRAPQKWRKFAIYALSQRRVAQAVLQIARRAATAFAIPEHAAPWLGACGVAIEGEAGLRWANVG
jgi:hypothetical protein